MENPTNWASQNNENIYLKTVLFRVDMLDCQYKLEWSTKHLAIFVSNFSPLSLIVHRLSKILFDTYDVNWPFFMLLVLF